MISSTPPLTKKQYKKHIRELKKTMKERKTINLMTIPTRHEVICTRQLIYKKVKVLMPHCPFCKEQLKGNGSDFSPYTCGCGEWKGDWQNPGYYKIKINL